MGDGALKLQITEAMKDAMRSKEKDRLSTIRLVLAAFKQVEVDERIDVDDARALAILDKMVKQRRDSIAQFDQAGRQDLVDKEAAEIRVIQEFLPQALTSEEIGSLINEAVTASGATGPQDMGKIMAILKPQMQGRADMGVVSQLVKTALTGRS